LETTKPVFGYKTRATMATRRTGSAPRPDPARPQRAAQKNATLTLRLLEMLGNLLTQPLCGLYLLGTVGIILWRVIKRTSNNGVRKSSSGTAAMVMWQVRA